MKASQIPRRKKKCPIAKGILSKVQPGLGALNRAQRLQSVAGEVGFDWDDPAPAIAKLDEEAGELREAVKKGDRRHMAEELGDLFFALVNIARLLGFDAEKLLAGCNRKFERRFGHIEKELARRGILFEDCDLDYLDGLWEDAKKMELGRR